MKECRLCHSTLPEEAFFKNATYGSGRESRCKTCVSKLSSIYYERKRSAVTIKLCRGCRTERSIKEFIRPGNKIGRICQTCMVTCRSCLNVLSTESFNRSIGHRGGHASRCRDCEAKYRKPYADKARENTKRWALNNPSKKKLHAIRTRLRLRYGITESDFLLAHRERNGCCDICSRQCPSGPAHLLEIKCGLVVDHCHATGAVRGLICGKCNTAIGLLGDNSRLVEIALGYLKRNGLRLARLS